MGNSREILSKSVAGNFFVVLSTFKIDETIFAEVHYTGADESLDTLKLVRQFFCGELPQAAQKINTTVYSFLDGFKSALEILKVQEPTDG